MVTDEGWANEKVHDLQGGIMAWEERVVPDFPKVQVFDKSQSLSELLFLSMELEKGAFRFYIHVRDKFASKPVSSTFDQLSEAEIAHAKAVYHHWKKTTDDAPAFDSLYEGLKGDILEGGQDLAELVGRVDALEGDVCMHLIELALHIENTAFDLYRSMAEQTESEEAREVFLGIAQAEKAHMRTLIDAIAQCEASQQ